MELTSRWPQLEAFCRHAGDFPRLQIWLFGSAIDSVAPEDIDVLVIYHDRSEVVELRNREAWDHQDPPVHILAMTEAEERFYGFLNFTGARRIL